MGFAVVLPEAIPGPDHWKPVPDVVAPERTIDVVVQLRLPPVADAPGGEILLLTRAVAVLVQPLAEFVAVSVYVPLAVTVGFAVVPPEAIPGPDHWNPVPDVVAPERTTAVVVHVRVPPVALAPGEEVLLLTNTVAVLVQPLAEFVTVTLYVPEELTLGFAVVPPDTIPGPLQLNPVPAVVAAERTTDVVEQVSTPPVALAPGTVTF